MTTKFCYAINGEHLSGVAGYPDLLDNSLESLSQFADPSDVEIIYTPPHNIDHIDDLRSRGYHVHENDSHRINWRSAMKLYLCDIRADNLIFLDADTVIYDDPRKLIEKHDFEFAARPDPMTISYGAMDQQIWCETYANLGLDYLPVFTTGFDIFCNKLHRRIKDDWIDFWDRYFDGELVNPRDPGTRKYCEMFAFALAISKNTDVSDIFFMDRTHQSLEFHGDPLDTYVRELERIDGRSWDEIKAEVEELTND